MRLLCDLLRMFHAHVSREGTDLLPHSELRAHTTLTAFRGIPRAAIRRHMSLAVGMRVPRDRDKILRVATREEAVAGGLL